MTPNKRTQKEALQRKLGFNIDTKIPMFSIAGEFNEEAFDILGNTLDGMLHLGVQLVLNKPKDKKYLNYIQSLVSKYANQIAFLENTAENKKRLYSVPDVVIVFSDDSKQVRKIWESKSVPLTYLHGVAIDYNPTKEVGNGFIYEKSNMWSFFIAVVRACETYRFPFDWNTIIMNGNR